LERFSASETSSAKLYNKGIFTTIAIVDAAPFLWEKHWRRLTAHAAKLAIDVSDYSEAEVFEALTHEIEKAELKQGRARITFSEESDSEVWSHGHETKTSLSIITARRRPLPNDFSLTVSPHRVNTTSPIAGVKSCNYLEHLLAYKEAKIRGFDEAIRLSERAEIASACMANVFWLKGGKLFTPSLETGCLAGTTREHVLENLDCEEVEVGIEEFNKTEALFLTSAGIGIVRVRDFDGKQFDASEYEIQKLSPFCD
jgi:branched-chain amino acid aminotransferase